MIVIILKQKKMMMPVEVRHKEFEIGCNIHGFTSERINDPTFFFESRAIHQLCAIVLQENGKDPIFQKFAEQVVTSELQILLRHSLQRAGYDDPILLQPPQVEEDEKNEEGIDDNDNDRTTTTDEKGISSSSSSNSNTESMTGAIGAASTVTTINEDNALVAAKKVSSAHLQNFETSGYIILRRVIATGEFGDEGSSSSSSATTILSAMAGIACELLKSPACKQLDSSSSSSSSSSLMGNVPTRKLLQIQMSMLENPNSDLSPGDCLAQIIFSTKEEEDNNNNNNTVFHDDDSSSQQQRQQQKCHDDDDDDDDTSLTTMLFIFEPCQENDPNVLFLNRLFGSKGETPTTVVKWSKGTIF